MSRARRALLEKFGGSLGRDAHVKWLSADACTGTRAGRYSYLWSSKTKNMLTSLPHLPSTQFLDETHTTSTPSADVWSELRVSPRIWRMSLLRRYVSTLLMDVSGEMGVAEQLRRMSRPKRLRLQTRGRCRVRDARCSRSSEDLSGETLM